mgnify:CR=1 FL=1
MIVYKMFVFVSFLIQCLYSDIVYIVLYSFIMFIILCLFKMLVDKPTIMNRTHHCLACAKLYPQNYEHCYKCHTCFPDGYTHVRMFRTCLNEKYYFVWSLVRNMLLLLFCVYNFLYGIYSKIFVDLLLIGISLI